MDIKTNYSFELYYTEQSASNASQRDALMGKLGPSIAALLTAKDSAAKVTVSDSHKGSGNKIVEITTTMPEADMDGLLRQFCDTNGVTITALE